jgi:hypothetical protein
MSRTYRLRLEHASRPITPAFIEWSRTELEPRTFRRWLRRRWLLVRMNYREFELIREASIARAWAARERIASQHSHENLTDEQINQLTRKELSR